MFLHLPMIYPPVETLLRKQTLLPWKQKLFLREFRIISLLPCLNFCFGMIFRLPTREILLRSSLYFAVNTNFYRSWVLLAKFFLLWKHFRLIMFPQQCFLALFAQRHTSQNPSLRFIHVQTQYNLPREVMEFFATFKGSHDSSGIGAMKCGGMGGWGLWFPNISNKES